MPIDFNDEQIDKLKNLGIEVGMGRVFSDKNRFLMTKKKSDNNLRIVVGSVFVGLAGFGMLVLLKKDTNKSVAKVLVEADGGEVVARVSPSTNVQKHLLASQQYFSQALQAQASGLNDEVIEFLNKSIDEASLAISNFSSDFRGYQQRGKIYQSLISGNESLSDQDKGFLDQAIADLNKAYKLNTELAEISRDLASLYARQGDADMTIYYLSETIRIEPTKAQNFYDLARIQSQSGDIVSALETYKQLVWLVSDSGQKAVIEEEKKSLEMILAQNPDLKQKVNSRYSMPTPTEGVYGDGPKIEANKQRSGVIIAQAETREELEVSGMSQSNSYSGEAILEAGVADIEIKNKNLTDRSQVYVTILSGGKNQVLRVKSKSKDSFRVGFDTAISEDVSFKWWIVD